MANIKTKLILNRLGRWLKSAGGITITLTIVAASLAAIDKGSYIIVQTIVTGGMWALVAMGLALIFGVMNITSFVHGEFFMIGSLVAYFLITPFVDKIADNPDTLWAAVIPLVIMFAALVAGAIAGAISEHVVFRPMRKRSKKDWLMNSFVLTLGLSVILINSHQVFLGASFKGVVKYWYYPSISIFGAYISFDRLMVFIIAMFSISGFWVLMRLTKVGRAIRAVSQSENGAIITGVNIDAIQTLTLALSCGMAALAGAALLFMYPAYPTVGLGPLYNSWFIVIVAGLGNVAGAAFGGFLVALLQVLTTVYIGEGWDYTVPVAFLMLVLVFKPSGIFGSEVRGKLE
jgi:branched-chain amino acid transport system permease protein